MPKKRTANDVANEILALQVERSELEEQADAIKKKEEVLKTELCEIATKNNLTYGGNDSSKWTIKREEMPQVKDWDQFYTYIKDNNYFHLLQRRAAVKACQEIWAMMENNMIPGVEKFIKPVVQVKKGK